MKTVFRLLPASWTRVQKTVCTILLAMAVLLLFLWLMDYPIALLPEPIGSAAQQLALGARTTVLLTCVAGLFGLILGIALALAKLSRFTPLRLGADFFVWAIRGTPLLVQILFVFLALPLLLQSAFAALGLTGLAQGFELSDFNSAVIALAFNAGAYNAEAIRAGIQAIHKGQNEAARSLGLSSFQTFRDVIFPQSFRIALPSLANNFVALLKDSSLAYVIGLAELSNIGNRIQSQSFQPIPVFITVACLYLILTTFLTQISGAIERQLDLEQSR